MKQKYKVFINDKEIEFIRHSEGYVSASIILSDELPPRQMVNAVSESENTPHRKYVVVSADPARSFKKFTDNFKLIEAAGGLVLPGGDDGKILMIYRLGYWDLPKGKIDKGENQKEAALREVEEECGIGELIILKELQKTWHLYFHKGNWVVKLTHWFLMRTTDVKIPKPQESENITEAKWVSEEEIKTILPLCYSSIRNLIENEILNR